MSAVLTRSGRNDLWPDAWRVGTTGLTVLQDSHNKQREGERWKSNLQLQSHQAVQTAPDNLSATLAKPTSLQPCPKRRSPTGTQGPLCGPLFRPLAGNLSHSRPEVREAFLTPGSWRQHRGEVTPQHWNAHVQKETLIKSRATFTIMHSSHLGHIWELSLKSQNSQKKSGGKHFRMIRCTQRAMWGCSGC